MKHTLLSIFQKRSKDDSITIVSGLPRSGTSMMMQMLEAGGIPIVTDNVRTADEDNPRGYYELEKVKKIKEDDSWLDDCHGKAFKMVSELLYSLPPEKKYRVIFMKRNLEEMLASQNKMLERLGQQGANATDEEMLELFEKHLRNVYDWLSRQNNIEVAYVRYNDAIKNPHGTASAVSQFLGGKLDAQKMAQVVENSLYRQRK